MTKYVYTQVMDIPKNTKRWYHVKHLELKQAGEPEGLNGRVAQLVANKGATMSIDVADLENGKIRATVRNVFNTEADRDAYEAFVNEFEAERSAYETEHGITHTKTKTEEAE